MTGTSNDQSPPPQRKRSKVAVFIAIAVVVGLIVAGGLVAYKMIPEDAPDYTGNGTAPVMFKVEKGQTAAAIGNSLKSGDIVKSVTAFVQVAQKDDRAQGIQPGTYEMRKQMSAAAALDTLANPANMVQKSVTVPEGADAAKIAQLASAATKIPVADFVGVMKNPKALDLPAYAKGNVEGFLYPATYTAQPDSTAITILKAMVDQYKKVAVELKLDTQAATVGKTPYEILKIASLIQAEAAPKDFGRVSRVIYNRLQCKPYCANGEWINERLEFDSSKNYALGVKKLDLSTAEANVKSPYNLHDNPGLPPTPINNPGEAAIMAALSPDPGEWLYFVSDAGLDLHIFSTNIKDQNAANQERLSQLAKQQQGQ